MLLHHKSNGITPQKQCFYSVIPLFFYPNKNVHFTKLERY